MEHFAASRRVLVVDDNMDCADLIAEFMTLNGHDVAVAYSGQDAIVVARIFRPALIFLDIEMPLKNGFEGAAELRQVPSLSTTRIVALTGWDSDEFRGRVSAGGFDEHLTKPVQLHELLIQVERCGLALAA